PDLVIHASVRRFQRGHNSLAVRLDVKGKSVLLKECLMAAAPYQAYKTLFLKRRRPDKRKRHPALAFKKVAGWHLNLIHPTNHPY
ncbi:MULTISPECIES: hypothetical protein, partial [unclassified Kosakonia]|uniref:hypothetical protein n=1 Tax=unclassified Kosakonia TaxID=2632876 RepID=UPI001F358C35